MVKGKRFWDKADRSVGVHEANAQLVIFMGAGKCGVKSTNVTKHRGFQRQVPAKDITVGKTMARLLYGMELIFPPPPHLLTQIVNATLDCREIRTNHDPTEVFLMSLDVGHHKRGFWFNVIINKQKQMSGSGSRS
jgi:hypothetical protein